MRRTLRIVLVKSHAISEQHGSASIEMEIGKLIEAVKEMRLQIIRLGHSLSRPIKARARREILPELGILYIRPEVSCVLLWAFLGVFSLRNW